MRNFVGISGLLVLAMGLGACGDDNGGTASGALNETQSNAVATTINDTVRSALVQAGVPAFYRQPVSIDAKDVSPRSQAQATYTVNCSADGTATVSGSTDVNTEGGSSGNYNIDVTFDYTVTFDECASSADDSNTYTVGGSIDTTGTGTFVSSNSGQTLDIDYTTNSDGNISVTGGDVDVSSCAINTMSTISISGTSPNFTGTTNYSGSICGSTVNYSYSF